MSVRVSDHIVWYMPRVVQSTIIVLALLSVSISEIFLLTYKYGIKIYIFQVLVVFIVSG